MGIDLAGIFPVSTEESVMLSNQSIRYAVAVAGPRDTHSLVPAMDRSTGAAHRSLCLPESNQSIRAKEAWSEPARHDWLASRLAARRAAVSLLKCTVGQGDDIEIHQESSSNPAGTHVIARRVAARTETRQLTTPLSLSISLSHAEGHAIAAAASHPARVGVDLERAGRVSVEHADYFLSRRERRQQHTLTLTGLWALKESAWKALGCSDTTSFADLELIFDGGGCVRAIRLGSMVIPSLAELRHPWPGWIAAVVALNGVTE